VAQEYCRSTTYRDVSILVPCDVEISVSGTTYASPRSGKINLTHTLQLLSYKLLCLPDTATPASNAAIDFGFRKQGVAVLNLIKSEIQIVRLILNKSII
jgi:hypothetical protein